MLSNKEFFEQLREKEEWCNCFMTKEVYYGIDFELRQQIVLNEVRQMNNLFSTDEKHRELSKRLSKAKQDLRNYEFEINHR